MPILPAPLEFAADGTPRSSAYDDIYYSTDGGPGQARHVFLSGNGLPERWQGREQFVILETGFGLGLNLLSTWAAWRADPQRCTRLHFVSCELHPFKPESLAALHAPLVARHPEFAALAAELQAKWPTLAAGVHRIHLDHGRVVLTLFLGDAAEGLANLHASADAFYLDGFSPARNPDLWSARVFHLLSRLAAPGATLATWSVAGDVREGLRRAGFDTEKAPGFGGKREMLRGRYRGPGRSSPAPAQRHALVLGAGAAGTCVAERLAARGWDVDILDAADRPGAGASGNHAGVLRPLPSLDDNRLSRLTRAGTLYALQHIAHLATLGQPVRADTCGVLHLGRDTEQEAKQRTVVERLQWPTDLLRHVDREEASRIAGWPLPAGGWWFPSSGWVQPPSLCRANLAAHPERIRCHFEQTVARLERQNGEWLALDAEGRTVARAPHAILANGTGIRAFAQAAELPVISARGQVSLLPAQDASPPRVMVCRQGYVSPAVDGLRCAGASFGVGDDDPTVRLADHVQNLRKLENILPGYTADLDPAILGGRTGFRPASPDRLPMVGAPPAIGRADAPRRLQDIPRHENLWAISGFGSRGLVFAALMGETLASHLAGEPLPVEQDLWEALDPARFLLRPARTPVAED
ncbi:bifunctional tRNA (5-methylaminomethyl-2-thiouridine)(34)-methyltransferase MnmD/FAD-dependent 5-carboxymethylaminomethyl-2-thiouridine(34) oxidoreductase MnmC [Pseudothauera nasutitermitis]|uniref:tRNA 5-methylaminomethyl-2-thiouridine biosynthesis bifunctional protein MnmC n=1 Tax=Pseudothauera nasutitermitis TaxID=2565930 RepID=A0A4S4B330_9RHOO|nr:bifunctional tRNA (5-methylaminomethyl-2-thiouridine)(34)-methyltransferase MnmD/FAD-dependent 5-carboxymethylaminomethyl-2-thiouridine(34) oxidoreductase MnmC [Pseudothauera nasutitermitis]THF67067.1 bifunctional tRNA (5-methylaminomethyl-2-thiouridine)(34)-methyltransferase MnmD/FAD-dependent 5-carboxymethylaminomethyl-2-thiouridine(34) oxidoreductase MnmC [Pseudothauera nasutitermitis]